MARYVDEGAAVTLVTCTLGEEGEVLVDDLAHLASDQGDDLGEHRLGELKNAMDILGVSDFVRLGGDGRFRDSGMAYDPQGWAIRPRRPARGHLLDRRSAGGRERARSADQGSQAAGGDHLRPGRRIRPPRPRPGAPGGDVRRAAGRCAELSDRSRCGLAGPEGVVEHHEPKPDDRRHSGAARGGGHRDLEGLRSRGRGRAHDVRRLRHRRGDRRYAVGRPQAGRNAGPRHPDHRGRPVLRRVRGCWGTASGRRSSTCTPRGSRSQPPTAGPTTCSPGWTDLAS